MPALSLVVCVYCEGDLLQRLLRESAGCYDELVVVHDGPDTSGVRLVVESVGGRFFERQREYQQEPHWPFAWQQAKHDWILRLDADEFPSEEMKVWLRNFRQGPEPLHSVSGFTCFWPLWNGRRQVSKKWPDGRIFLFHRQRVRFFGMAEQVPVPDGRYEPLDLVLHHQPMRRSYGLRNVLVRKQAYRWRECIARSLLGNPTDLACWRWESTAWPGTWEQIRQRPLRTALWRLVRWTVSGLRRQWRLDGRFYFAEAITIPLHHALICLEYRRKRKLQARKAVNAQNGWKP